jgi:hypothetical protein
LLAVPGHRADRYSDSAGVLAAEREAIAALVAAIGDFNRAVAPAPVNR